MAVRDCMSITNGLRNSEPQIPNRSRPPYFQQSAAAVSVQCLLANFCLEVMPPKAILGRSLLWVQSLAAAPC